jgi:predicted helicase
MRQSLLDTYNKIRLVNLHGDSNVGENITNDENVFDIQQGVGISIMNRNYVRTIRSVEYMDVCGSRAEKHNTLSKTVSHHTMTPISPSSPLYLFLPVDECLRSEFESWPLLSDLMPFSTSGIVTSKDGLVIGFSDLEIKENIALFVDIELTDEQIKNRLNLSENYAWKLSDARRDLMADKQWPSKFDTIHYRPFDNRRILYHPAVVWRTRHDKMLPMRQMKNVALLATRQSSKSFTHISCTHHMIEMKSCSYDRNTEIYPLWIYDEKFELGDKASHIKANFNEKILTKLPPYLGSTDPYHILAYIFCVLHSNDYRKRYGSLLERSYPRIPFTSNKQLFHLMTDMGNELLSLHLLESDKLNKHIT